MRNGKEREEGKRNRGQRVGTRRARLPVRYNLGGLAYERRGTRGRMKREGHNEKERERQKTREMRDEAEKNEVRAAMPKR